MRRLVVLVGVMAVGSFAYGGDGPFHRGERGTPPPGKRRDIPHTHERAGYPLCLRGHVQPTMTPSVRGYYVGGGTAVHGDCRGAHDGTWGFDDTGFPAWMTPRVRLRWSHGRRYQGGTGAYETDAEEGAVHRLVPGHAAGD